MNTQETLAVVAIMATVILSFTYFLLLNTNKKGVNGNIRRNIVSAYVWKKSAGFLLFGFLPALSAAVIFGMDLSQLGLTMGTSRELWPWIAGASVLFIALNVLNSRQQSIRENYPEMRLYAWSTSNLGVMAGGWLLYLTGYEFLFRGLLLFSCYEAFGLWPAIAINLALYSTLHLPKGLKEATATLPFGVLIIYLTLESGSIVPAIIIHSVQAISCEICCIIRNENMKLNLVKS